MWPIKSKLGIEPQNYRWSHALTYKMLYVKEVQGPKGEKHKTDIQPGASLTNTQWNSWGEAVPWATPNKTESKSSEYWSIGYVI